MSPILKRHLRTVRRLVVLTGMACTPLLTGASTASADREVCSTDGDVDSSSTVDCLADNGAIIGQLTMKSTVTAALWLAQIEKLGCFAWGYDLSGYEAGRFVVNQGDTPTDHCLINAFTDQCTTSAIKHVVISCWAP